MAIALGGRLPDAKPDAPARQDGALRIAGRSAQVAAVAQAAPPDADISADANMFTVAQNASAAAPSAAGKAEQKPTFNWRLVKQSFAYATSDGVAAAEYFYARLFAVNPGIRGLFPASMTVQRERMFAALGKVIWSLDTEPECAALLRRMGREHRRYGVLDKHSDAFFAALRDTIEHGARSAWTADTSAAWQRAVDYFAATMRAGAATANDEPAVDCRDRQSRAAVTGRRGPPAADGRVVPLQGRPVRACPGREVVADLAAIFDRGRAERLWPAGTARPGRARRTGEQHARASLRRGRLRTARRG